MHATALPGMEARGTTACYATQAILSRLSLCVYEDINERMNGLGPWKWNTGNNHTVRMLVSG